MTTEFTYPDGATPLDPDELQGLKFKHVTTRTELDHLEQANIESSLQWLKRVGKLRKTVSGLFSHDALSR